MRIRIHFHQCCGSESGLDPDSLNPDSLNPDPQLLFSQYSQYFGVLFLKPFSEGKVPVREKFYFLRFYTVIVNVADRMYQYTFCRISVGDP
jgi:hypothetical protein